MGLCAAVMMLDARQSAEMQVSQSCLARGNQVPDAAHFCLQRKYFHTLQIKHLPLIHNHSNCAWQRGRDLVKLNLLFPISRFPTAQITVILEAGSHLQPPKPVKSKEEAAAANQLHFFYVFSFTPVIFLSDSPFLSLVAASQRLVSVISLYLQWELATFDWHVG